MRQGRPQGRALKKPLLNASGPLSYRGQSVVRAAVQKEEPAAPAAAATAAVPDETQSAEAPAEAAAPEDAAEMASAAEQTGDAESAEASGQEKAAPAAEAADEGGVAAEEMQQEESAESGGSAVVEPEADVAAALEDKTEEEPTALDESGLSRRTPLRSAHAPILMKVAGANYLDSATVSKKVNGIWVQASEVTVGDEVRVDLSFSFTRNTITSTDKDVTYTLPSGIRPEKALTRRHQ